MIQMTTVVTVGHPEPWEGDHIANPIAFLTKVKWLDAFRFFASIPQAPAVCYSWVVHNAVKESLFYDMHSLMGTQILNK